MREHNAAILAVVRQFPPRFRWASWGVPGFVPPGEKEPAAAKAAVERVKAWDGSLLVLRGPSGTGKTSLACAILRAEAEKSPEGIWFVSCDDVSPDALEQARARTLLLRGTAGRLVAIDDLGSDLSGAPAGGGLASYRGERVRKLIRTRHIMATEDEECPRTIVTLNLTNEQIEEAYGDDVLRRLTERRARTMILDLSGEK